MAAIEQRAFGRGPTIPLHSISMRHDMLASLRTVLVCATVFALASSVDHAQSTESARIGARTEIVVFGGTPGGIAAAVSAARAGRKVQLIEPSAWVGGMMSGGLSNTDTGQRGPEVISGLAGEFFRRVRVIEQMRGACLEPCASSFLFEPQVATQVFESMLREAGVAVERSAHLVDVKKNGTAITSLVTARGEVRADVFIDASYEGDLMKLAGVPFRIGREPRRMAGADDAAALAEQEDDAGVQRRQLPLGLHIDPYRVAGEPASGLVAFVEPRPDPLPEVGDGDARVTAYTYRLCVTDDPTNRIPFTRPERYAASDYELHARVAASAPADVDIARNMFNPARVARSRDKNFFKYDLNSSLTLSTDLTGDGLNQGYVDQPHAGREQIQRIYRDYIQGWFFAMQTEPRLKALHARVAQFGYCADEFTDNGGWPHQIYVRESRRMLGMFVMTENELLKTRPTPDPVGMGSYTIDSHNVQRYVTPDGAVQNEGDIGVSTNGPYSIAYGALVPRRGQAGNLIVPVCVSSSHIAFGSIRMEPVFMVLGQSAATAAAMAIDGGVALQDVPYAQLRERLLKDGQVLELR